MPKTKIYDESAMYDIEVGWSADGTVQLGVSTHDGVPVIAKIGGLEYELHGPHVTPPPGTTGPYESPWIGDIQQMQKLGSDPLSPAGFTGLWGTLDRQGINRLIKALRKARDEAYGKDE